MKIKQPPWPLHKSLALITQNIWLMNLHFTAVFYPKAKEGEAGLLILYMPLEELQLQSEKRSNLAG